MINGKKILILGLGKSGTTGISHTIFDALPETNRKIFHEPTAFGHAGYKKDRGENALFHKKITAQEGNIVSKCLVFPQCVPWESLTEIASFYTHVIWIDRDPRDRIISEMLYSWVTQKFKNKKHEEFWFNFRRRTIEQLQKKEKNPNSIPFLMTKRRFWRKEGTEKFRKLWTHAYQELNDFYPQLKNFHILKYEHFIDWQLDDLENFLGLSLNNDYTLPKKRQRVIRTSSYGNWRDWFTDEDVIFFKPLFESYLTLSGYDANDWKLNYPLSLDKKFGSDYVLGLINT